MHSNHPLTLKSSPLFLSFNLFITVAGLAFPWLRLRFSFPKEVILSLHSSEALRWPHLSLYTWTTLPYLHRCAVSGSYGCSGAHASLHSLIEDSGSTGGAPHYVAKTKVLHLTNAAHPVHTAAFTAAGSFPSCLWICSCCILTCF